MAIKSIKRRSIKRSDSQPSTTMSPPLSQTSHGFDYRRVHIFISVFLLLGVLVLLGISSSMWIKFGSVDQSQESSKVTKGGGIEPQIYGIQVIKEFPHDPGAFTQGLLYVENDTLFESTGLYGQSSVRKVALKTGKVEAFQKMNSSYFGEGLTLLGQRLFQVTWLKKTGFIYDRNNLSRFKEFTHQMQDGWGLATDGKVLFGSDGTSTLYHIDPKTLKVIRQDVVKYNGQEVRFLNELEFIGGEVWANVFMTDCIARISREGGMVLGWILLPQLRKGLIAAGYDGIDVLNGIAWNNKDDRVYVTGKLWPKLYEIKLLPTNKFHSADVKRLCLQSS
ncbi:glutaminyl-peptide cyclotransferase-like isoform X1 [Tripterygium wilfordii]|uniref:glutaminyl-peptide cyclotransferase-like isoform X1 n=1 Tax=Tripterygium wilfordii TaxID=458696 RepID=UPI0018F83F98|nr:glutaminyl-peptide cyclotransferase-like isoform X1 [Tripterygium wilfordii]